MFSKTIRFLIGLAFILIVCAPIVGIFGVAMGIIIIIALLAYTFDDKAP